MMRGFPLVGLDDYAVLSDLAVRLLEDGGGGREDTDHSPLMRKHFGNLLGSEVI